MSRIVLLERNEFIHSAISKALEKQSDFSKSLVLTPESADAFSLRRSLLQQRVGTLLPELLSLRNWIESNTPTQRKILNNHARELMLVEVLRDSQSIKGKGSAWQLADELLKLFDELELSGHDAESLVNNLANSESELFVDDANMVSFLWKARLEQMQAEGVTDRVQIYSEGLLNIGLCDQYDHIVIAGYDWLHQRELQWLLQAFERADVTLILSADVPLFDQISALGLPQPTRPAEPSYLDACFDKNKDILERSSQWIASGEATTESTISVFKAPSNEPEARFIDVQIRDWLHQGKQSIALVTEDRQLARRVSAILQHSGLSVHDDAGWALSTTVAAGTLERWLECIEQDFPYRALLDVLKSEFVQLPGIEQKDIYHFERDIIEHESIAARLDSYKKAINDRAKRLETINPDYPKRLLALVDAIHDAAQPLLKLAQADTHESSFGLSTCIEQLDQSLDKLGLASGYLRDTAGQRLLQELEDMRQSESQRNIQFSWMEFRSWLKRALETHNFRPARDDSPVRIMTLQQSMNGEYDAVILAGLDQAHLPKPPARLVFFNDQVKQKLGLQSANAARDRQFFQFKQLLEYCPEVVLSYSQEVDGAPQLPSPWLAKLSAFCKLTSGKAISEPNLSKLEYSAASIRLQNNQTEVAKPNQPWPAASGDLLPQHLSASSHQQLIDCPYKFFSAYLLSLKAPEEIIDQMTNRDFGNRAHLCLQAFHSDVHGLPGPFKETIQNENREQALELLLELGNIVFAPDNEPDLRHKNWFNYVECAGPRLFGLAGTSPSELANTAD